jgi:tetratricopeptide (TPR) repeat protein
MSRILYEQYKDALRRGHVAALRGRLEIAAIAYQEAAELAPDRALPHASLASVLHRLGRTEAAEAAYGTALRQVPHDEGALRGRAVLLAELGRRSEAAADFEQLATVLEESDRVIDAGDAARRALELAESRARRQTVERLVARLRALDADPAATEALRLAIRLLDPPVERAAEHVSEASPDSESGAARDPSGADARPVDDPMPGSDHSAGPEPSVAPPIIDLAARRAEAEEFLDAGDMTGARAVLVGLASGYRAAGLHDAALDAGFQLLTIDPSDSAVQLEFAASQFDRGWGEIAEEKVRLLARLADLDADPAAAAAIAAFAAERRGPRRRRGDDRDR